MRTLRLLLAVGLGLAPTLAATAAGTTPAFAGGGAGMTLTATMDGQGQRLLVGTDHVVHIVLADTPGEADLRNITISLSDLDPRPLPVTCPAGRNGHLSLEPDESLTCTATVTAEIGARTLVVRATADVPSLPSLLRTRTLHYTGFRPAPPTPPDPPTTRVPVHAPLRPVPVATTSRPPTLVAPVPTPTPTDPPKAVDPPKPADPPTGTGCADGAARGAAGGGCCGTAEAGKSGGGCCGTPAAGKTGVSGQAGDCGKAAVKHDGLAFTGMSAPMLTGAAGGGLLLVAGGFLLVRRFARR